MAANIARSLIIFTTPTLPSPIKGEGILDLDYVKYFRDTILAWRPVFLVTPRNLSAAVSRVAPTKLHPDLARIRACQEVVEAYH